MGPAAAVCVAEVEGARTHACGKPGSLAEVLTPVVGDAFLGGGMGVSLAICRLRRLEGQGTTVVARKALRLENFEWGVGNQKE